MFPPLPNDARRHVFGGRPYQYLQAIVMELAEEWNAIPRWKRMRWAVRKLFALKLWVTKTTCPTEFNDFLDWDRSKLFNFPAIQGKTTLRGVAITMLLRRMVLHGAGRET